jgi:uncharacterized protein YndB with AHSA1/START domain
VLWNHVVMAESYRGSIHIDAEPEVVFDYFTQPDALVRWMGDYAILEPRPGGQFTLILGGRTVQGRYVSLEPPHRLVITWGRQGSATFPPGSSTLEVTLAAEAGGTRVTVVHTGLPASETHRHVLGWELYLDRLAVVAAGGQVADHGVPAELTEGAD